MTKKLFALLIAASLIAQPIIAQEAGKTPEEQQAYERGAKKGMLDALALSSFAAFAYAATTIKNGFYIPAKIKCQAIQTGWRTSSPFQNKWHAHPIFQRREPEYSIVCEDNPLFSNMNDSKVFDDYKMSGCIQKIDNFLPYTLMAASFCAFVGVIWYYSRLDQKSDQADAKLVCD